MSIESIKSAIAGQDFKIAVTMCGLQEVHNNRERHQACPVCGGKDRFWYKDKLRLFTCRQCGLCVDIIGLVQVTNNCSCSDACRLLEGFLGSRVEYKPMPTQETQPKVVEVIAKTEYQYCDTSGKELYRICRTDFLDESGIRGKKFSPLWTDEHGNKQFREPPKLVPYNLHRLGLAKTIFIVEGEKTADCLNRMFRQADFPHAVATTSQGGSNRGYLWENFIEEYPALKGKTIRILPDNDDPGRKYAQVVSNAFVKEGAQDVKIVTIPKLPDKGDFVDWYDDGTEDCPEKAKAALAMLVQWSKESAPLNIAIPIEIPKKHTFREVQQLQKDEQHITFAKGYRNGLISASELKDKPIPKLDWLVKSIIPTGYTLLLGQSKIGKSWLLLQTALQVGNGDYMFGKYPCVKNKVLYLSMEDNQRRLKDRILKLGIDSENVLIDTAGQVTYDNYKFVLDEMPEVKMVIVDTFACLIRDTKYDINAYKDMYDVCGRLKDDAHRRNISLVLCHHTRKSLGKTENDFTESSMGSKAIVAAADTVLRLSRERDSDIGMFDITGKDMYERSFEVQHDMNWHWRTDYEEMEQCTESELEVTEWVP